MWSALAEIGRQLQLLASAHMGRGPFCVQTPPPAHPGPSQCDLTVAGLTSEFLRVKARAGKSDRYLRALRNSLIKFVTGRGNVPINAVTVYDVEKWMNGQGWSARTRRGYVADVRTMFNFAVKRGHLQINPAAGVELPAVASVVPGIHTPEEVATVLEFARGYDAHICRALAVRYFTGLRSAEADRLAEAAIRDRHIEVTAENSKTRRRRLVTIQPNLRAWLALGGVLPVRGCKSNVWRDFTASLARHTEVVWSHNVTRHSFCSYHLAAFQNAGQTALQAGHSEAMLFHHYREVVSPEAAAEFWAIVPKTTR